MDSPYEKQYDDAVAQGIRHAEAQARLLRIAEHMAGHADGGCDQPIADPDNWDGEQARCGGCWPCLLSQLKHAVDEVKATAVTFSEVASAVAKTKDVT